MTTKKKTTPKNRIADVETNGNGQQPQGLKIPGIEKHYLTFTIVADASSLIQHKWSEKAKLEMRQREGGRKTKDRKPKDPEQECKDATYTTEDGLTGIHAGALRACMISAAHKDLGIEKTQVCKALFFVAPDKTNVIPFSNEPTMLNREDPVRVGRGGTELRYRPEFFNWECEITAIIDSTILQPEDVLRLVNRAGFGAGLHEWRPEKGGTFGRFKVDTSKPISLVVEKAQDEFVITRD